MLLPPDPEPAFHTHLGVDGLAYHAAQRALARACRAELRVSKIRARCDRLIATLDSIDTGRRSMAADKAESLAHRLEGAEFALGRAYAPVLQATATVHVMAAVCLEAHINSQAKRTLPGAEYDLFERFALDAKWLTLPKLLGLSGFEGGQQPLQGVMQLVRHRNGLVHYKDRSEPWTPPGVPSFLERLGLSVEAARQSLGSAQSAVTALSQQLGAPVPFWLRDPGWHYFEVWGPAKPGESSAAGATEGAK